MLPPPPLIPDLIGVANASDLSTAFTQGQAMGAAGKAAAQSNITAGQAANVVPNYTSSATESSYFSGGQGSLSGPALSKVSGCASGAPNPDPYKRQECEAVNFLAKNPAQRQQFAIGKSDPLLAGAKPILANPSALAGSMDGSYSACSTQTVEQPAQYSTEVCNQYADMAQSTCQRVLKVTVTQEPGPPVCSPGTWNRTGLYMARWYQAYNGSGCWYFPVEYYCDPSAMTSGLTLRWVNVYEPQNNVCFAINFPPSSQYLAVGGRIATAAGYGYGGSSYYSLTCSSDKTSCSITQDSSGVDYYSVPVTAKPIALTSLVTTITKSWDNQCATLEAKAQ